MHFGISPCPPIQVNQCQSSSSAFIYIAIHLSAGLSTLLFLGWISSLLPSCLWKIMDPRLESPVGTLAESRMPNGQSIVQQYYPVTTPPLLWARHSTLFVLHSPWFFSSPRRRAASPTVSMTPTSLFRGWFSIKLWIYMYSLFHRFHAWPLAISNLLIILVNSWLFSMSSTL